MKIAIAGDSAGILLVAVLAPYLASCKGIEVSDLSRSADGTAEYYASVAERVAVAVANKEFDRGILCCGTGIGMAISANKVPGIRAAQTHDCYSATRAAKSNDAQIITLGARVIGSELAKSIVDAWIASAFDPEGASADNVAAMNALDERLRK